MAGDLNFNVGVAVDNALRNLGKLSDAIQKTGNDFEQISNKITGFATVLGASLTALAGSAMAFADELSDVAAANETTIASVLGLSSALQAAGGSADNAGRLLQSLSNNIEGANQGNMKMVSAFQRLGVSISDLGTLSQDEIRNKTIKALAAMEDPIARSALAMDVFGKAAVGVDWKQMAADVDTNTAKYKENEAAIKTAGEAFDNLGKIYKDLKIAVAEAFEPLFKYIAKLKIDIPTLTTLVKIFAAALMVAVSASVLAGFAKLLAILKDINMVVSKNKLITIIGTLLSVGVGVATWSGLMKDVDTATQDVAESQKDVQEATNNTKRDQSGLLDAIKKQKEALSQVTEQFNRQVENIRQKLQFEQEALNLTEEQKKVKQEQNAIDQAAQNALSSLKQKYDGMDKVARDARAGDYAKEKKLIEDNAAAAKKDVESRINLTNQLQQRMKEFQSFITEVNDVNQKRFELITKAMIDQSGYTEKIDLEQKLITLQKIRTSMTEGLVGLTAKEKEEANQAITIATTHRAMLGSSYDKMNEGINKHIESLVKEGIVSQKVADAIVASNADVRVSIAENGAELTKVTQQIARESRTFESGWKKAFNQFADNAMNAAQAAERIFQKMTSGMEDLIVGFAKTGKFAWKDFVNSMVEELLRSQVRQLMAQIFNLNRGVSAGGGAGLLGGAIIPGFLANGGPATANKPYIVGERGPELFVPGTSGQVVPNEALVGGTNVTYNINAVDALSFKQMIAADPSFIYAVTQQGAKSVPMTRR